MYVLDISLLQPGDIILSRSSDRLSTLVRKQSNSNYSHAALVVEDSTCVESTFDGVHSENTQRLGFEQQDDAVVLRLIKPASTTELGIATNFARAKVGTDYASRQEVTLSYSAKGANAQEQNRQYCTRLVAQAYLAAGITLVSNADYCTPGDIERSALLKPEPNCLIKASKEREEWVREAERGEAITIKQASITSQFLVEVQQLTGMDLQTLEQVEDYLVSERAYDKQIAELMTASGYLEMGDEEKAQNPWYYDLAEFEKKGNEQQRLAFAFVQESREFIRHQSYTDAAKKYAELVKSLQSGYFLIMFRWAARQSELSRERMDVWSATVDSYLPFQFDMDEVS